jgi:hypothetical protein
MIFTSCRSRRTEETRMAFFMRILASVLHAAFPESRVISPWTAIIGMLIALAFFAALTAWIVTRAA